jgi:GTP cyclohydrolase FolE2
MSVELTSTPPQADPQAEFDLRGIALDAVGISRVRYPFLISGWENDPNRSEIKECVFTLEVSLAAEARGIHMSRLLETLHRWQEPLSPATLPALLQSLRQQQNAHSAAMSCLFTWFVNRLAPQSGLPAWQGIETIWHGRQDQTCNVVGYTLRIAVTTLCPCSRAISDYGAHSQRGWISVRIEWPEAAHVVTPQQVFEKLQHAGSAPIYPLLKRKDERHVTMQAYQHPAFVEDVARQAALLLRDDLRISSFQIEVCNEESIHTHDAIARLSYTRSKENPA